MMDLLSNSPGTMRVLHHASCGYVAACTCCNRLQIGFGTCVMVMEEEEVQALMEELAYHHRTFRDKVDPGRKIFPYDLHSKNVHLLLNYGEVGALYELLSQALLIHRVYGLLAVEEP